MNRLLKLVVAGSFLAAGFIGCGLLDATEDTTPKITLDAIGSIDVGTFKNVEGKVTAGENITSISYAVEDANGTSVAQTKIKATGPSSAADKKIEFKDNDAIKIEVFTGAAAADYTLKITVTAGTTIDASFPFTVAGGSTGTAVATVSLDVGSNDNATLGSSVDLDGGVVWLSAAAKNNVSKIDLCYSYSGTTSSDKVGSPSWAKTSGFSYATTWDNPPSTTMIKVSKTSAEFDAITTKEAVEALWTGTAESALVVAAGDVFIVKTTENVYALVRVETQTAGATGKITIKVAR